MVKIDVSIYICCRYIFLSSTNCVMFSFKTNHNSVGDSINITTYVYIENERFSRWFFEWRTELNGQFPPRRTPLRPAPSIRLRVMSVL